MRKKTLIPIDGAKLKELVLSKGYVRDVAEAMGYTGPAISRTFVVGKISQPMMMSLQSVWNIKYEDYKPEEPKKEEPVLEDRPTTETEVVSRDEALLKTIVAQLGALNNSLTAIYQKLEEINR